MEQQVATVLGAVIVAGILWLAKSASESRETLVEVVTLLKGENGVTATVKELRERAHRHGDAIHGLQGKADLHERRLDEIEERLA